MVFCYKLLTESPRRCASSSPTRINSQALDCNAKGSFGALSQFPGIDTCAGREMLTDEILDSIPKRDWRLLAALVHKREERDEIERLADEFRKMWSEEKGQREELEAQMSEQYRRYISKRREADRRWLEQRRARRCREMQLQRAKLLDVIQYKERKSANLLATLDDRKVAMLAERSLEEDVRAFLAAQRRTRLGAAGDWCRRGESEAAKQRADEARQRREARLHDSSRLKYFSRYKNFLHCGLEAINDRCHQFDDNVRDQRVNVLSERVFIGNALSSWECSMIRREIETLDAIKRISAVARLADAEERGKKVERARRVRQSRAKRAAQAAELLRAAVIGYRR